MNKKFFFVVSRNFQVERYVQYIRSLGLEVCQYKFICVSDWTGGDAGWRLTEHPCTYVRRPKFFKKAVFGNFIQHCFCLIAAWLRILRWSVKDDDKKQTCVFIDQYFSPLEFLGISSCPNVTQIFVHQHSFNCGNQLSTSARRKIFALLSHKLLRWYISIRLKSKVQYVGLFFSVEARELAGKNCNIEKAFLVDDLHIKEFSDGFELRHVGPWNKSMETAVVVSPGMFRYRNNSLINAQLSYFSEAFDLLMALTSLSAIKVRPKPGEELKYFRNKVFGGVSVTVSDEAFRDVIRKYDIVVCPSVSTTWCQALSVGSSVLVLRNDALEEEYPFFSDLLVSLSTSGVPFETIGDNNAYLFESKHAKQISCKMFELLNLSNEPARVDIVDIVYG